MLQLFNYRYILHNSDALCIPIEYGQSILLAVGLVNVLTCPQNMQQLLPPPLLVIIIVLTIIILLIIVVDRLQSVIDDEFC